MEANVSAIYRPEQYFAALKLIEQLYRDGLLPAFIFRNILNDHADTVDLSLFCITDNKEEAA